MTVAMTRYFGSRRSNIASSPGRMKALKFLYGKAWGMSLNQAVCKNLRGGSSEEEGASVAGGGGVGGLFSVRALFRGFSYDLFILDVGGSLLRS